ncbi:MAG: YdiU family protein [Gammaproteobacteria bacterium]|nr:YdiU family protein [Gammaproteobacteria bacterium]
MQALSFDNRFVKELPADGNTGSARRQVHNACYSFIEPTRVSAPGLVSYAREVAQLLDLDDADCQSEEFLQVFAGNKMTAGMQPYAMCYGGHQFGNWAGQLGDGRAINLGEVVNASGEHWALQLKGAGATPYSRTADGLAVLRSSIREYLCSEVMHHLGVPTTRALSLVTTGEQVMRDMLYDGHPEYEPGAIVCRVSPSFIRFGNFQIFSSRNELAELWQLADFTIRHHFKDLLDQYPAASKQLYAAWFSEVCRLTMEMIVHWMRVGFVHGVMNTDNMSILGLTIDYGPYGWLDNYDPKWTPNTTDAQSRRYRFGQQPNVALWNLYQLANSIYPLIEDTQPLESALERFQNDYQKQSREMMAGKLGLRTFVEDDQSLFAGLEALLVSEETDMTLFYRLLGNCDELSYQSLLDAYYDPGAHDQDFIDRVDHWLECYKQRVQVDDRPLKQRRAAMNRVNPKYVFRNFLAQQAIDKAEQGDYTMVGELLELFRHPYDEQPDMQHYAVKRPDWARTKVGCSMLSCSS